MMIRMFVIIMWFLLSVTCYAEDLSSLFNQYVTIDNRGTVFTLLGVEYNGSFYSGTWELQDDFSYRLIDVNIVDESNYFNLSKAGKVARNSVEIQREEIGDYGFDIEGCLSFSKFVEDGFTSYVCSGKNFVKYLGKVNETVKYKYRNFIFPMFLASNTSYATTVEVNKNYNDNISNYEMNFVISVYKTQDEWIEHYSVIIPIANYINPNYAVRRRPVNNRQSFFSITC